MTDLAVKEAAQPVEAERASNVFRPTVDLLELEDRYEVHADVPGARADDIDVSFEQGNLSVEVPVAPRRQHLDIEEYRVGDWRFGASFGDRVDAENIGARYEQGVLIVTLPKARAVRPHRVAVHAG